MTLTRKSLAFISLTIAFLLACSTLSDLDLSINSQIEINAPTESAINLALTEQAQTEVAIEELEYPPLDVSRIAIRTVDGVAEFYQVNSGERFLPIGVNYVDFYLNGRGEYNDSFMATHIYDPDRVRKAFQVLKSHGYNTVRIFFDTCGYGANCIGNAQSPGLNSGYLDNMVDVMHIAGEEGIYILFTANSVPESGGYWEYFDRQVHQEDVREGFSEYNNSDWLHPAGVEFKRRFWHDLMNGMVERDAPFEVMLGWQLTNEYWLFKNYPPLNLDSGLITPANEQTYDLSVPGEKEQMIADSTLFFMEEIVAIIKSYDPEALTTMGFFAPQYPNPTGIGGDWYVDTAPLIDEAAIDFWDMHAYFDTDLNIQQQTENFGIVGYTAKPVLLGETAAGHALVPSAATALTIGANWLHEACLLGWDGWLYWGFYPWPEDMEGPPWTLLEEDNLLLEALAPNNWPEPCEAPPTFAIASVSYQRPVRYSAQLSNEPARGVVDGTPLIWNSGDYPPQWVEVTLDEGVPVQQVSVITAMWPASQVRFQVSAQLADGKQVVIAHYDRYTAINTLSKFELPQALEDVTAVRVTILQGEAWAALRDMDVISGPAAGSACLAQSGGTSTIYREPSLNAEPIGTIFSGGWVYAHSRYIDDSGDTWFSLPGDGWLHAAGLALSENCETVQNVVSEPFSAIETVKVELRVTVPAGTPGEVFLAGDFGPDTIYPLWDPSGILFKPQGNNVWAYILTLPVGNTINYRYTRNYWDSLERDGTCQDILERAVNITPDLVLVEDTVIQWRDIDDCD
jgi:hypothetical protein